MSLMRLCEHRLCTLRRFPRYSVSLGQAKYIEAERDQKNFSYRLINISDVCSVSPNELKLLRSNLITLLPCCYALLNKKKIILFKKLGKKFRLI